MSKRRIIWKVDKSVQVHADFSVSTGVRSKRKLVATIYDGHELGLTETATLIAHAPAMRAALETLLAKHSLTPEAYELITKTLESINDSET